MKEFDRDDKAVHKIPNIECFEGSTLVMKEGISLRNANNVPGQMDVESALSNGKGYLFRQFHHFSNCCHNTKIVKHANCDSDYSPDDSDEDFFNGTITAEDIIWSGNSIKNEEEVDNCFFWNEIRKQVYL